MEQVTGIEPASSGWKPEILAIKLHLRKELFHYSTNLMLAHELLNQR